MSVATLERPAETDAAPDLSEIIGFPGAWYVAHAKVGLEGKAEASLRGAGFAVYLPRLKRVVRHARRELVVQRPLFPRYLFFGFELGVRSFYAARAADGVESLVGSSGVPRTIPGRIVEDLARAELAGDFDQTRAPIVAPVHEFQKGDPVVVTGGPLLGFTARVLRAPPRERVMILLDLFARETIAEVAVSMLRQSEGREG